MCGCALLTWARMIRLLGTAVIGSCELHDVNVRNWTEVLGKTSKYS